MVYKVKFSDSSEGYLSHHGILGMHWGVRNSDTIAKYESGNGGQMRGTGSNASYGKLSEIRQRMHSKKVREDAKQMVKDGANTVAAASLFLGSSKLYHMSKTPQGRAKIAKGVKAVKSAKAKAVLAKAAASPKVRAAAAKGAKVASKLIFKR